MSDNISIILKAILSNDKADIEAQIRKLSSEIKERLELKLKINTDDLQIVTKQVEETTKKLKLKTVTKDSMFINKKVEQQAFNEITAKLREVQKNVNILADVKTKYSIDAQGRNKLETATLTYYNKELGQTITETMNWVESTKKVNDELQKVRTFRTTSKVADDKSNVQEEKRIEIYKKTSLELKKLQQNATATNSVLRNFGTEQHHKKADQLTTSLKQLNITQNMTQKEMQETIANAKLLSNQLSNVSREAKSTGNHSMTMGKMIGTAMEKFSIWMGVTAIFFSSLRAIRQNVTEVIALNSAVTELNKVLEVSKEELVLYTENAFKMGETLGRTGKDVILATAEFARAGFSLQESAKLAEQALLLTNVADGLEDTAEAAGYLIAVLKGYNLTANDTVHIVDLLNEVSNNYAVNTVKLAEGLQRTAGTLSQTGTSMEELAGILTGGFEVLRNMEKVSSGLI